MIKLDSNINEKFDEIVQNQKNNSTIKNKHYTNIFSSLEREKIEENKAYKDFYDEYKQLYSNDRYYYVYRIDKIMELFKKYLYINDELSINNMYMYDYVRIALTFFDFLISNYYMTFYESNKNIDKNTFNEKIEKLSNALKSSNQEVPFDEYQELRESLTLFWNPFDKKLVKDLIKLYYIIKNNSEICSSVKITKRNIENFITFKCVEYNVIDGAFEFLTHAPNSLNTWYINNIYDSNSAKIVYSLLQEKGSKINYYNKKLIDYFNNIISVLKESNDNYFSQIYIQFNSINIKSLNIEEKIKIFRELEIKVFKDLKIFGTYGYDKLYDEIFFDYSIEPIFEYEKNKQHPDINISNKKEKLLLEKQIGNYIDGVIKGAEQLKELEKEFDNEEDIIKYFDEIFQKNNINLDLDLDDLSKDEVENIGIGFLTHFSDFNTSDENNNETYKYITNDYLTENKLRLLYQEMKGFFENIAYEIESFKYMKDSFISLSDIPRLIKESEDVCCMYELSELSNFYKEITIKENYDKNDAYKYLIADFNVINHINAEDIVNQILNYTNVKKVLLSASYLWNLFEKTSNMEIDKDGRDYTPIVANYFKSVELLLFYKIKDKQKKMVEQGGELLPIYTARGAIINILEDNEITLGEIYKYIKREKRLVKDYLDNNILASKIKYWSDNVRNSHFHKDLILSKSLAYSLKQDTLQLLDEIIYYFD